MREPVVAGKFYPAGKEALLASIRKSFLTGLGVDKPDVPEQVMAAGPERFVAVVSPHAGYVFSGSVASHAFNFLARDGFPETILLLGPLHYPTPDKFFLSMEDFSTPLGRIENNNELGKLLLAGRSPLIRSDSSHEKEHSLEVQLPFLQYLAPRPFKIVPIGFSRHSYRSTRNLGRHIASVLKKYWKQGGGSVGVVASSDFCHVGPSYGYTPIIGSGKTIVKWMETHDGEAMDYICNLDGQGFDKYRNKLGLTICGTYPILTTMELAKEMGVKKGEKLDYITSYEQAKNMHSIVGYGAIGFRQG